MCKSDQNCKRFWKHASRKEWLTSEVEGCDKINLKGKLPIENELIAFRRLRKAEE